MDIGTMICVGLLGVFAFVLLIALFYLLGSTISDLRYTSKKLKQIQKERDELWNQYVSNCKK